ncbi:MAG: cyclic nucleotide-binding domain-containing protein [Gammaproteobacteria bacterium]|nr:cyclic nucleotide-binding domain-containing protein [Gammaproteobacteria bacterium]
MAIAPKQKALRILKNLVPLNLLPEDDLEKLLDNAVFEKLNKNQILFKEGDKDHENVYLLSGKVKLISAGTEMDRVQAGSETARFPLVHQIPRRFTVVVLNKAEVVRLDSRLLGELVDKAGRKGDGVEDLDTGDDDDWMNKLLQLRIFQQIPPAHIQKVMMCMEDMNTRQGDVIVNQGDEGDYFYLINKGQCGVSRINAPGEEPQQLAKLGPGDSFGEESLLSGQVRMGSITMLTDGHLLRLRKQDFVRYVKDPVTSVIDYRKALAEVENGSTWIDVRSTQAFERFRIPGSVSLPMGSLRYQASTLDPERSYIVCDDHGSDSVTAAFLLMELGFQVSSLDTGLSALPQDVFEGEWTPEFGAADDSGADFVPGDEVTPDVGDSSLEPPVEEQTEVTVISEQQVEQIAGLEQRLEEAEQALAETEKEVLAGQAALQEAEALSQRLESELSESQKVAAQVDTLGDEVRALEGHVEKESEHSKRLATEKDQLQFELVEGGKELVSLKNTLKERDEEIGKLSSRLSRVNIQLKEKSGSDETGQLRDELAEAVLRRESAERELKNVTQLLEHQNTESEQIKVLEAELETLTDALEESDNSGESAIMRVAELEDGENRRTKELEALRSQEHELTLQVTAIGNEKKVLQQEFEEFQELLDVRNKEVEHLKEQAHNSRIEVDSTTLEIKQLKRELGEARLEAEEAELKRKEAVDSRQQVTDALYRARQQADESESKGKAAQFIVEDEDHSTRKLVLGAVAGVILTLGLVEGFSFLSGNGEIISSLLNNREGEIPAEMVQIASEPTAAGKKSKD